MRWNGMNAALFKLMPQDSDLRLVANKERWLEAGNTLRTLGMVRTLASS